MSPRARWFLVVVLACVPAVAWTIIAVIVVPSVIQSAYKDDASWVARYLVSIDATSADVHLDWWYNKSSGVLLWLLAMGAATALLARCEFRPYVEGGIASVMASAAARATGGAISKRRMVIANGIIIVLVCGHLYDIVVRREHWPFSFYSMYSVVPSGSDFTALRLYGLPVDGADEVPMTDAQWLHPFDQGRMLHAFVKILSSQADGRAVERALEDCLYRYERNRRTARHHGAPLRGVRLYRLQWNVDRRAANAGEPHRRELLAEFYPTDRRAAGSW